MLLRLLRQFSLPYRVGLAVVVGLQLVSTIAALYLPTLNADIIDNGVSKGAAARTNSAGRAKAAPAQPLANAPTAARSSSQAAPPAGADGDWETF